MPVLERLNFYGTSGDDVGSASMLDANTVEASLNGTVMQFSLAPITSIQFFGNDGHDSFQNLTAQLHRRCGAVLATTCLTLEATAIDIIYGNDGVDTIRGNGGDDLLYGHSHRRLRFTAEMATINCMEALGTITSKVEPEMIY